VLKFIETLLYYFAFSFPSTVVLRSKHITCTPALKLQQPLQASRLPDAGLSLIITGTFEVPA
jgi:hypothetical protein